MILSRKGLGFNSGAGGPRARAAGRRRVFYDRRGHSASAGGGVLGARGGTTEAPRAAAKPLEGIYAEQEVKGVLWGIKTRQM